MQISSRFTIAIHTLLCIAHFNKDYKVTSNFIASSVNVNSVIIRRILGQLKEAGLVNVEAGVGGASIVKDLSDITLFDIFKAVECVDGELFNFHDNPNIKCPVGNKIHNILDCRLESIQHVMEEQMSSITLQMLADDMLNSINCKNK